MKAQAWKIWISDGWLGASHGMFYPVVEIYIPELQLAMNESGFHVWDDDRYSPKIITLDEFALDHEWENHQPQLLREIDVDGETVSAARSVVDAIQAEEKLAEKITTLFGDLFEVEDEEDEDEEDEHDHDDEVSNILL